MKIKKYLEQSPLLAINLAYEVIIPSLNKKLRDQELNLLQGLVLTALFFEERTDITPSQLAEIFETSRGNMSHILSHLEYKGWVRRVVNARDARQFQIELKPEGKKKALSLIKFYDKIQNQFEKKLGTSHCQKTIQGIRLLIEAYKSVE